MKSGENTGKRKLTIKTFKIPIERDGDKVIEKQIEITEDMVINTEGLELKSPMLELPTETKKIALYNKRQILMAEKDPTRDYIKKKIITK